MKRFLLGFAMAAVLAGCGSSVKLDQPPVGDRASVGSGTRGAGGSSAGQSSVAPVDLTNSAQTGVGPAGTANIIYFDFDTLVVKSEYQGVVDGHGRFLRANQGRKLMIEGHTDERGGREYNPALGQKRAEAVRRALGLETFVALQSAEVLDILGSFRGEDGVERNLLAANATVGRGLGRIGWVHDGALLIGHRICHERRLKACSAVASERKNNPARASAAMPQCSPMKALTVVPASTAARSGRWQGQVSTASAPHR